MCDSCNCAPPHAHGEKKKKVVDVHQSLLAANDEQAAVNRKLFESLGAVAINLISSPGSGKTTLLEKTIDHLASSLRIGVIEGDIETDRDAARIRARGVPAVQLTTGGACHLDAPLVHKGVQELIGQGAAPFDLLFIENVGNLVCPASFDLGEHVRLVLLSVPEGPDKPAKYPKPFRGSQGFLITKIDLLPYFDFSLDEAKKEALLLNPELSLFEISATSGHGMDNWLAYLRGLVEGRRK